MPSGGGGGLSVDGPAPSCLDFGAFDAPFEVRSDGPWPVCEDGTEPYVQSSGLRDDRVCGGALHAVSLYDGDVTNWRWDGDFRTVRVVCAVPPSAQAAYGLAWDPSDRDETCEEWCWSGQCGGLGTCAE